MYRPIVERKPLTCSLVHPNPILNRVLQNRGISSQADIEYSLSKLLPYESMMGLDKAVELISSAIKNQDTIMILGDFDCDGATSTAIMTEGLYALGAAHVEYMVPHRMRHGYGLTPKVTDEFVHHDPKLLVTVDNGIAAFEGIEAVRQKLPDCRILVTDHHLASGRGLPDADCIVNPSQPGCAFPSKSIAGCGVAFYTIMATRAHMEKHALFEQLGISKPPLAPLLDLLALGTVADVVPLDNNNRNIVDAGLRMINSGTVRPGLRAILEEKGRAIGKIQSSDFGFAAGPCLNAARRLEDMTIGIRCLLSQSDEEARRLAKELAGLNERRKSIENDMKEEAELQVSRSNAEYGYVIYNPDWHEGVVGIVASRIKDATNRPAICMTNTEDANRCLARIREQEAIGASPEELKSLYENLDEQPIKGSARSVDGIHIKHLIDRISKNHDYIFLGYGGHSMAAGMSIWKKHLPEFMELFDRYAKEEMTPEILSGKLVVDIVNLHASHITMDNAILFRDITPWGQKFEEPVFSGIFRVLKKNPVGVNKQHLQLVLEKDGMQFKAIAFNAAKDGVDNFSDTVEVIYKLSINEFRGSVSLQLMIDYIQNIAERHLTQPEECFVVNKESQDASRKRAVVF